MYCNNYWQQYCNPLCKQHGCAAPQSCATGFSFLKRDMKTGKALKDASFSLLSSGMVVAVAHSDACGRVTFPYVVPGTYYLRETKAPAGYSENPSIYTVSKDEYGFVTIDGHPSGGFVLDNKPVKA